MGNLYGVFVFWSIDNSINSIMCLKLPMYKYMYIMHVRQ